MYLLVLALENPIKISLHLCQKSQEVFCFHKFLIFLICCIKLSPSNLHIQFYWLLHKPVGTGVMGECGKRFEGTVG